MEKKINTYTIIFSFIFCLGAYYRMTPLHSLLGSNHQFSLVLIFGATILWFIFNEPSNFLRIINSRYIFLIISLILSFISVGSYSYLRELLITLSLLPIIFSKKIDINNLVKCIVIINIIFLILTSFIEIFNYLNLIDLNNWDVSKVPWIDINSPAGARSKLSLICIYNPYFISFIEYIGTNCSNFVSDGVRRITFFWIEPTTVMYSSAFILLAFSTGIIRNLKLNIIILFLINVLSKSATSLGSLMIILFLRVLRLFPSINLPRFYKYLLSVPLVSLSIIIFLRLIEKFLKEKSSNASLIFNMFNSIFNNVTIFGSTDLFIKNDYTYGAVITYGAGTVPLIFGIVGSIAWLIVYLPFFLRSYTFLGLNKNYQDNKSITAYCALLILCVIQLRFTGLFAPTIILVGEYLKLKFPLQKE